MKRSYIDTPLSAGGTVTLPSKTFHHLFRVMRCRDGEPIIAFNGDGFDYYGTLQQTDKKQAVIHVEKRQENTNESPLHTTLLQGLSKGDRMDTAIQKAVELGVNTIYPIDTEFSTIKLDAKRLQKKHEHWQAIIISACEQSERATLPTLHPLQRLDEVLPQLHCDYGLFLHPYTDNVGQDIAQNVGDNVVQNIKRVAILIGPEGGLSDNDIRQARAAGFAAKQLGKRILRTETATVSALTLVQYLWGDYAE